MTTELSLEAQFKFQSMKLELEKMSKEDLLTYTLKLLEYQLSYEQYVKANLLKL